MVTNGSHASYACVGDRLMMRRCCKILEWWLQTDRMRRMRVCVCVCVCAILMRRCCKILEWWLQTDRMRRMRVCVRSWCDYVVKSWSDGYKRIACVICVCVCDPDATMLSNLGVMITNGSHASYACVCAIGWWCDDVVKSWSGAWNCAICCSPHCGPFVSITPKFDNIVASGSHTQIHTYDACDPFVSITPRFYNIVASSPYRAHTHKHIRRMRSVCKHHSKIWQHIRIRIAHTNTHIRRMRSVCKHHSKILQHSRIRIANTHMLRMRSVCNHHSKILQHNRIRIAHTHRDIRIRCMQSVCNHHSKILQHSRIRIAHTHTHIRRMRSVCNHHSKILQHSRIITRSRTHTHTRIRRMRSVCKHHSKILQHSRIRIAHTHTQTHTTYAIRL